MKTAIAIAGACLLAAGAFSARGDTSSRGLREVVNLGSQGEEPQGSGRFFPPGIGVWGTESFQFTGDGDLCSFDPSVYPIPPSDIALMGPGHAGSNDRIYLDGSVRVTGMIRTTQAVRDASMGYPFDSEVIDAGWSCSVGSKLPTGLTGEAGDDFQYSGARVATPLSGWDGTKQNPDRQSYSSGTPCWPKDPGYPVIAPFYPQWDMNGDGTTSAADYDYFVAHGGFAAQRGAPETTIPYTEKDDPTIMKMDKGVLVPASEGQAWYDD
nr:hypothetical protein [bacterium]